MALTFDALSVGDTLPDLVTDKITRTTLALYCGASGDHNPIHVDIDFARAHGMEDVFAHGMLNMAYLGRLVTNWVPQSAIRSLSTRFTAITPVNTVMTCTGTVAAKRVEGGEKLVELDLVATASDGEVKLKGSATVALPE
ncbi:MaoC family dehydratase [Shimia biformata]|uniref:MaoC family dehydratase n=1 Tax=Shimia biformata TaxID=1294299 RepID=UPI001EF2F330|nr:MaoC family dehydratase [Shimia biformata]